MAAASLHSNETLWALLLNNSSRPLQGVPGPDTSFEWNWVNAGALLLACLCALLANSAGIGGGPFYMPLFNSVLGFDINSSTALSHTVVACSAIASSLYGILQRNPLDDHTSLIDFTLALTFIPALLVGTGLGVIFNSLLPNWLQSLGLVILLSFVIYKTGKKAVHAWKAETQQKRQQEHLGVGEQHIHDEEEPLHTESETKEEGSALSRGMAHLRHGKWAEMSHDVFMELNHLKHVVENGNLQHVKERVSTSVVPLLLIIVLWVVFLSFKLGMTRSEKCSPPYFAFWAGQTAFCGCVTLVMVLVQMRKLKNNPASMDRGMQQLLLGRDNERSQQDGVFKLLQAVCIMVVAGATAGLLGIGGALIFNPFLLAMGVHPQVTASTAVVMILFSSSTISISFYLQHMLNSSYAAWFAPSCFVASLVGVSVVGGVIKRTGRASLIIIILVSLIVLGTFFTTFVGGYRAYEDFRAGRNLGFKNLCD